MIHIEDMTDKDIPCVSELQCACHRFMAKRDGWTPEQLQSMMTDRGSLEVTKRLAKEEKFLVARDESVIVGVVAFKQNEIDKLYVEPERHGEGTGRLLFQTVENMIREEGHDTISLCSFEGTVSFYKKMGMEVVGLKEITFGPLVGLTNTVLEKGLV
ncbi:GNAT family N-acetyltransferase [Candidatus Hydrogenedentota bacterium]